MLIPTEIGADLRVDGNLLGHDLVNEILDELTIVNRARRKAKKRNRPGWQDMPEDFLLGDLDGDTLVMPRGYAMEYKLLLRERGHTVWWVDKRIWHGGKRFGVREFSYRDHQPAAVRAIRKHQFGIYEAPTGSGKTVTCCGVIWATHPQDVLILVDKIELLDQWEKALVNHAGVNKSDIGNIGAGKWNEKRFTIATVQTLYRALKEGKLKPSFFKKWSIVILDECHHVTAETIMDLFSRFYARLRFGVSATPDREDDKWEIALSVIGDVMYADSEDVLREAGIITVPTVHRIFTRFDHPYWSDHQSDRNGNCQKPGCKIRKAHGHRNNYSQMKAALVRDTGRNALVASCVLSQVKTGKHIHLVSSDETTHLEELRKAIVAGAKATRTKIPPVYMLTGKMTRLQRGKLVQQIHDASDAILLSTVAKEGLDIPGIDRIYLPFPIKNARVTEQKIGRGTRQSDSKDDTLIFDFCDRLVTVLRRQFKNRADKCYGPLGLELVL